MNTRLGEATLSMSHLSQTLSWKMARQDGRCAWIHLMRSKDPAGIVHDHFSGECDRGGRWKGSKIKIPHAMRLAAIKAMNRVLEDTDTGTLLHAYDLACVMRPLDKETKQEAEARRQELRQGLADPDIQAVVDHSKWDLAEELGREWIKQIGWRDRRH